MNDVTYVIVRCVVIVLATIVSAFVIPYLKAKVQEMNDAKLLEAIKMAVQAAEQTLSGGTVKKEEVLNYMSAWLLQHNISITAEQLDKLIESAVYVLKQDKKKEEKE